MRSDSSEKDTKDTYIGPKTEEEAKYEDYNIFQLYSLALYYTMLVCLYQLLGVLWTPIDWVVDCFSGESAEDLIQDDYDVQQKESEEQKQVVVEKLDKLKAGLASGAQLLQELESPDVDEDNYMTLPPATENDTLAAQILGEDAESGSDPEDLD